MKSKVWAEAVFEDGSICMKIIYDGYGFNKDILEKGAVGWFYGK